MIMFLHSFPSFVFVFYVLSFIHFLKPLLFVSPMWNVFSRWFRFVLFEKVAFCFQTFPAECLPFLSLVSVFDVDAFCPLRPSVCHCQRENAREMNEARQCAVGSVALYICLCLSNAWDEGQVEQCQTQTVFSIILVFINLAVRMFPSLTFFFTFFGSRWEMTKCVCVCVRVFFDWLCVRFSLTRKRH